MAPRSALERSNAWEYGGAAWFLAARVRDVVPFNARVAGLMRECGLRARGAAKCGDYLTSLLDDWGVSVEIRELLARVDAQRRRLDASRPLTAGEVQRLRDEFMVDFTYNSNAIEGNTLTLRETALVLEGVTIDRKPLKDHLEAVGHRDAFLYLERIAQNKIGLREAQIKAIHSLVLIDRPEDKGIYRRIPVRIAGAVVEPVQPYLIELKMGELLARNEERKQILHPLERVALFHLEFEGIHPFIDGNGRTGRLVLNLELMREGYPAINIKFADRARYYNAFDVFYGDNRADDMVQLVAEAVSERLDRYLELAGG